MWAQPRPLRLVPIKTSEPAFNKSSVRELGFSRRPRACFWTADDGRVYISLRYGTRAIEIAKGKSAIEIGELRQLVPVVEALKQAVAAGEVDQQLTAAGAVVSSRFAR